MPPPGDRIQVIEASLGCFQYGLVSLVPLIGIPFILLANQAYLTARNTASVEWNPAGRYLRTGHGLCCLGGFV